MLTTYSCNITSRVYIFDFDRIADSGCKKKLTRAGLQPRGGWPCSQWSALPVLGLPTATLYLKALGQPTSIQSRSKVCIVPVKADKKNYFELIWFTFKNIFKFFGVWKTYCCYCEVKQCPRSWMTFSYWHWGSAALAVMSQASVVFYDGKSWFPSELLVFKEWYHNFRCT
jgi:hypothetical protein